MKLGASQQSCTSPRASSVLGTRDHNDTSVDTNEDHEKLFLERQAPSHLAGQLGWGPLSESEAEARASSRRLAAQPNWSYKKLFLKLQALGPESTTPAGGAASKPPWLKLELGLEL